MYYLIYKITHLDSGKIYIGKHMTEDKNDSYMGSGKYLRNAIQCHGIDRFKKEILFECSSLKEMNEKEAELVNQEFIDRDDTYNIKLGGDGGWDYINTNDLNIGFKYANATGLNNSGRKGKPLSSYQKQRISNGIKLAKELNPEKFDQSGSKNHMFGKKQSFETRQKMSESHKGKNNPMSLRMWIRNPITHEYKVWLKDVPIPAGWEKGKYQYKKI